MRQSRPRHSKGLREMNEICLHLTVPLHLAACCSVPCVVCRSTRISRSLPFALALSLSGPTADVTLPKSDGNDSAVEVR